MAISQDFVPLLNSRNVFIHCLNFCFVFFLFLLVLLDFSFVYLTSRRFSDLRRKSVEWTCKIYYISCILYIQRLNGFSFLCFFPFKLPWRFRQRFRWLFLQYREIETFPIVGHKLDCLLKPFVRASYSALGCCSIAILQPFLYLCSLILCGFIMNQSGLYCQPDCPGAEPQFLRAVVQCWTHRRCR